MVMRKAVSLAAALLMVLSLAACGNSSGDGTGGKGDGSVRVDPDWDFHDGIQPRSFGEPVILTSAGQSADMDVVNELCTEAGLLVYADKMFAPGNLSPDTKTLIVSVGTSAAGLSTSGTDQATELQRAAELMKSAGEMGVRVIAVHTGGETRRGDVNDELISQVFPQADAAVVLSSGDSDGMMAELLNQSEVPSAIVQDIPAFIEALQGAFGISRTSS